MGCHSSSVIVVFPGHHSGSPAYAYDATAFCVITAIAPPGRVPAIFDGPFASLFSFPFSSHLVQMP